MIKTLLLTGEHNHDWARTSPFVKTLLEGTGEFEVMLREDANAALEEGVSGYDLFFLDYNGPMWSDQARRNFEEAISGGTGVVILHGADNAFDGWTEYETMCGLSFRENSGHGEFHTFTVEFTDTDHPITRGLSSFQTTDELYHRMVHRHDAPYHVLADAFSDAATGGTGRREPLMLSTQFGQGRIFHTLLGHVWPGEFNGGYLGVTLIALETPNFQETLRRGCLWAAKVL